MRVLWGSIAELEEGYQEYFHKVRNFPVFARKQKVPCTVCEDPPSLKMPCKHAMCPTCLMKYVWTEVNEKRRRMKKCPNCNTICERLDPSNNRVSCQVCHLFGRAEDFCWYCQMPWSNGRSLLQCGNAQCSTSYMKHHW